MLSVLGTALTTVQIVQKAGAALSILCNEASREAEEPVDLRVEVLIFELECAFNNLSQWQQLWVPEDVKSEAYFLELWGQAGQRDILRQLEKIQGPALAILDQADLLKRAIENGDVTTMKKTTRGWFRRLFTLPISPGQSHTIQDRLKRDSVELAFNVTQLQENTDVYFKSMHDASIKDEADLDQRINHIIATRAASTAIYEECERKVLALDLDLNLLNNDHDADSFPDVFEYSDLPLTYHLVLPDVYATGQTRHIKLDPTSADDTIQESTTTNESSPDDLLQLTNVDPRCSFQCDLSLQEDFSTAHFNGESFVDDIWKRSEHEVLIPLQHESLSGRKSRKKPLRRAQKIKLAFQVIQPSLFLLGTPWLSHLSSKTLMNISDFDKNGDCSLHIDMKPMVMIPECGIQMLEMRQIRQLGILLFEIALETKWAGSETGFESPAAEAMDQIEAELGLSYKQACEYCLNMAREDRHDIREGSELLSNNPRATLALFYTNVYLRLRDSSLALT